MKSINFLFTILFSQLAFGQTIKEVYIPNHFTVTIKDGYNKAKFTPTFGKDIVEDRLGHIFQAQFTYVFNVKPNFGIIAQSNVGIGAFTFKLTPKNGFDGTERWNRFYRDSYNPFFKLSSGVNYHKQLKPKLVFNASVGGGLSINGNSYFGITGGVCLDNQCLQIDQIYNVNYQYSDDIIPYSFLDLNLSYLLKNQNFIGLTVSGEIFSKPTLTGNYVLYNSTSGGTISNRNNNLAIGLNYTFTHYKKYIFNQKLQAEKGITKKEQRQIYKKDKRYVNPKSIFVSMGSGMFFGRNIYNDPDQVFRSNSLASWTIFANAEVGIKNQFYYEAGIEFSEYWNSIKFTEYGSSGGNAFIATKLNLGLSKRIVNKTTNRNFINIHAGVGISFQPNNKGNYSGGGGIISSDNVTINFTSTNTIKHHIFPSLYMALEKDLHLTKNLYLSLKYKYDQGFVNVSTGEIKYNTDPTLNYFKVISSKINGTANTFTIGFKYKFLTVNKKQTN